MTRPFLPKQHKDIFPPFKLFNLSASACDGYVSRMLANPNEQNLKIKCKYKDSDGAIVEKEINFNEYKEIYPKHYEFFEKLLTEKLKPDPDFYRPDF